MPNINKNKQNKYITESEDIIFDGKNSQKVFII